MIDLIRSGFFSRGDTELFRPLLDNLLYHDPYLVLADFSSYRDCQQQVSRRATRIRNPGCACPSSISARSGLFSSDRTIREYCRDIWHAQAGAGAAAVARRK